jgi:WS/DGAT/MGAT family acyltransferase
LAKKITFIDKGFWLTETDNNPKHVASLQLLTMPEDAPQSYLSDLYEELKSHNKAVDPFNTVVKTFLGFPLKLKSEKLLDTDYHIQFHNLGDCFNRAIVHQRVSELHEIRLDPKKPLWQFHLFGFDHGRDFAIYIKIHHMYGDGATLIKWFQGAYNTTKSTENYVPVWAKKHDKKRVARKISFKDVLLGVWNFLWALKDFLWIIFRILLKLLRINKAYMPVPFTGTKTILTGQVKAGRVVATTDLSFNRVKLLSKRYRASINEILLCCFDIATHRFLKNYGQIFDKALYTNMPINLRKPGDQSSGNKITIVPVELAYNEKDPYLRLRQIIENHRLVIKAAKGSHPASFSYYTVFIQSFSLLYELLHLSNFVRPIANILISNMPGPRELRYLKDSELKAVYPISTITPGGGVNITLMTYGDMANVGIVCCDNDIKSLEPLVKYFHEAFELLEKSGNDPSLSIDDIGETSDDEDVSKVIEPY